MVELRDGPGLAAEALELIGVVGDVAVHELHRDPALEHGVEREVDRRHPARADLRVEAVATAQLGPDERAHGSYCADPVRVHVLCVTDPACPESWGGRADAPAPAGGVRRAGGDHLRDGGPGAVSSTHPAPSCRRGCRRPPRAGCRSTGGCGSTRRPRARIRRAWRSRRRPSRASTARTCGALREALAVEGRRADNPDALVALAADVAGMNVDRFRVDLQSNAIVEAFGADLDKARAGEVPRWEVEGSAATDVLAAVRAAGATSRRCRRSRRRWPVRRDRRRGARRGVRPARPAGAVRAVAAGDGLQSAPRRRAQPASVASGVAARRCCSSRRRSRPARDWRTIALAPGALP